MKLTAQLAPQQHSLTAARVLALLAIFLKHSNTSSLELGLTWVLGASSSAAKLPTSALSPTAAAAAAETAATRIIRAAAACTVWRRRSVVAGTRVHMSQAGS